VVEIVVVGFEPDLGRLRKLAASSPAMRKVSAVVAGGETRSDSVAAGAGAVRSDAALIAVHDVARPLVETDLVERAIAVAAARGAAVVAIPVTDTIKTSSDGKCAESTLDRSLLWRAQTPQVSARALRSLLERPARVTVDGRRRAPRDTSDLCRSSSATRIISRSPSLRTPVGGDDPARGEIA
jgi:2-C-methyl-D-erythritol 4-phosphate cytidylyltransferase